MKAIKRRREALGIKQADMAAQLGVSQPTIANWESEGSYPPSRVMPDLAAFFDCTIDELYADEPEKEVS